LKLKGSDGRIYKQILKGNKDGVRQDAVIEQLFVLSSRLLQHRDPSLSIRNYRVIPLTPTCGVIEFVERVISIQDWHYRLHGQDVDQKAGYFRYPPNNAPEDKAFRDVYDHFSKMSTEYHRNHTKQGEQKLIEYFNNCLLELPPIFRFFFIERFPNPGNWFQARMSFCRHTATNSMVGYLFGVGDRHLHNILIDVETGELVHIDLGIAFEQGRAIPIPELVPFRLTQGLTDGMGRYGFEGVFRRVCQQTLSVLRKNSEYLLVILEVLVNDPLSTWTVVPKKQQGQLLLSDQPRTERELTTKTAESIMVTCRRKLDGREMGEGMSVEGQVAKLIAEATNGRSLAMMFHGWKPFI
jgi:ataxia telangiectasia mutated family protein